MPLVEQGADFTVDENRLMNSKSLANILLFLLLLLSLWTAVVMFRVEWPLVAQPKPQMEMESQPATNPTAVAVAAPADPTTTAVLIATATSVAEATATNPAEATATDDTAATAAMLVETATAPAEAVAVAPPATTAASVKKAYVIYADGANGEWQEWSWSATSQFAASTPVHQGSAALAVTYDAAWGAFYLHSNESIATNDYDLLRFWIHGGSNGGQRLRVVLADDSNAFLTESKEVTAPADSWTLVEIPLAELGAPARIGGIAWQDSVGDVQATFYLDELALIDLDLPPTPTPEPVAGPGLKVDLSADRRPINPDIYGMNYADEELASTLKLPVRRWGGNATTRYNWQNDTTNRASDWFFENIPEENANPEHLPEGSSAERFIEQDQRTGTKTLLTMPMIGWAAKSRDITCGFSVARYGPQQQTDDWRSDCGNGMTPAGEAIIGNDPTDTSIPIDAGFVEDWIAHLIARFGTAAQGGVAYYNLDNEPMLWHHTHRDVHPEPVGYDELRDRTYTYGAAIKAADPTAQTLGPAEWGWTGYFFSALDGKNGGNWWDNAPDRAAHDGLPLVAWYLQQMQLYEQQHGVRILDYLDLHYYPQATGVALAPAGDTATRALRLRSTRSLWDPTYTDESWIDEPVKLIRLMREWVDTYYPGTKLALSEYNFGALDHINGALTQADVLGIFGREGLDLAFLWAPLSVNDPFAFAFRLYRNYDGTGSAFGDTSVQAISTDQEQLAIYAAQRSQDNALTIIVINKSNATLISQVAISGFDLPTTAQGFRYSTDNLQAIQALPEQTLTDTGLQGTFPGQSITLFVLQSASSDNGS